MGEIAKPEKCEEMRLRKKACWQLGFQNKSGAPCVCRIIQDLKEQVRLYFSQQIGSFIFLLPRLVTLSKKF